MPGLQGDLSATIHYCWLYDIFDTNISQFTNRNCPLLNINLPRLCGDSSSLEASSSVSNSILIGSRGWPTQASILDCTRNDVPDPRLVLGIPVRTYNDYEFCKTTCRLQAWTGSICFFIQIALRTMLLSPFQSWSTLTQLLFKQFKLFPNVEVSWCVYMRLLLGDSYTDKYICAKENQRTHGKTTLATIQHKDINYLTTTTAITGKNIN